MPDYNLHQFPNGIRVVHKQVTNTKIAHCGIILNIGSRDEKPNQQGLAHFWEHMAFKGTKKRKAFHILNRLDSVGGELNAYTTKEKICFYASALDLYFENALELLADITFDSIFPEKQIEKEKNVILEEMAMYLDSPEDAIQDDFDSIVFPNHPLGNNILGTTETVKSFHRNDFKQFISENLNTEEVIFSSVSAMPFNKVVKLAEKYLKDIPSSTAATDREPFIRSAAETKQVTRNISQAHCAIGREAYAFSDKKKLPFITVVNLLGGPAMNSRLNLSIREKLGYVYSIEANYSPFSDTGLFAIYFATEAKQLKRSVNAVFKELNSLKNKPLGTAQLHKVKEQLIGQMAMAEENNASIMMMMGKSLLNTSKIDSFETVVKKVKSITSDEMLEVANDIFDRENTSILTYVPNKISS